MKVREMQEEIKKFCETKTTCGDCELYEIETNYKDCEKVNDEETLKCMCKVIEQEQLIKTVQEINPELEVEKLHYIALTKTQIERLKKFISGNIHRELLDIDTLCDMCGIYEKLEKYNNCD